jgi:hypothetical protein
MPFDYVYYGDRNTATVLKGKFCSAVRINGKCSRGKNGNMLVKFENGVFHVVLARLLRKTQNSKA